MLAGSGDDRRAYFKWRTTPLVGKLIDLTSVDAHFIKKMVQV